VEKSIGKRNRTLTQTGQDLGTEREGRLCRLGEMMATVKPCYRARNARKRECPVDELGKVDKELCGFGFWGTREKRKKPASVKTEDRDLALNSGGRTA